ncbi:rhodanese-like domain-containing protein [Ottowia thiooxydans]|uniref:rhodanese-like domain-containing protein n=1 Tax=Ottowia thiooxydans TaxID=219182 RepID=UPI00041BEB59|nr:rhodanese-like domain-containing protein [Ottowia thiooxydans]
MSAILAAVPDAIAPAVTIKTISARQLVARLQDSREIAVIDVRELARHVDDGHVLQSIPLPLSQLELQVDALIPRRDTPVVVYDAGFEGLAERGAQRLIEVGYRDVALLSGGVQGWRDAGFEVYTGWHVLSKAFGEFVEHAYGTPHIPPEELKSLLDSSADLVVLDGRNIDEFYNFSIPGAHAVPNAELPYRVHDLVPSKDTLVVINCAGRTRSIIGAQALINTGLPNRVVALENGAMAWLHAGYPLNTKHHNTAPTPSHAGLQKALRSISQLRERFAIQEVDRSELDALRADTSRTLYLLDVRTREEYQDGHLPLSVWAEGGQLVQATDQWIATHHARVVLIDDRNGVRSAITASWLIQLGWKDVYTYGLDTATDALEIGPGRRSAVGLPAPASQITTDELKEGLDAKKISLFDFSGSQSYRASHIPGAQFALRSRIDQRLLDAAAGRDIVVVAADPALARLVAADIARIAGNDKVRVFAGANQAWKDSGQTLQGADHAQWHDPADDVWLSPYFREDRFGAFKTYIDWEVGLIDQLKRDTTISFKHYGQHA